MFTAKPIGKEVLETADIKVIALATAQPSKEPPKLNAYALKADVHETGRSRRHEAARGGLLRVAAQTDDSRAALEDQRR